MSLAGLKGQSLLPERRHEAKDNADRAIAMFRRILTLLDPTPRQQFAVQYGVKLARTSGAEVHLIGVIALPVVETTIDEVRELEDQGRWAFQSVMRQAREYAEREGQPVTTEVLAGPPASTVLRLVAARSVDLIVISQEGHALDHEWRQVARTAPCPVFVACKAVVEQSTGPGDHRTAKSSE